MEDTNRWQERTERNKWAASVLQELQRHVVVVVCW
jgi:hypothetical protein